MDWQFLQRIRMAETGLALAAISQHKAKGAQVIEIGGGAGWQAQELAAAGYEITSFDLPNSEYAGRRVFPIRDYDGYTIPAPERSCDVIFSSNVLEHIPHVAALQSELHRVLRPGGVAVHLVPSAAWRFWTIAGHYPWVAKAAAESLFAAHTPATAAVATAVGRHSIAGLAARIVVPPRHGEVGNAFTELWHFSRYRWTPLFEKTGWVVTQRTTNQLFYSGHSLLGPSMGLQARRAVSRVLGSTCHLYVLRPHTDGHHARS
jgi:ubiquinone/menaquinone biosynthesis C-methylase UbiE